MMSRGVFFKLPGEIRNMISEYALVDSRNCLRFQAPLNGSVDRVYLRQPDLHGPDRDDLPQHEGLRGQDERTSLDYYFTSYEKRQPLPNEKLSVALFATCKQINAEAAPLFYGGNIFSFGIQAHCTNFRRRIKQRLPLVRKVTLNEGGENNCFAIEN